MGVGPTARPEPKDIQGLLSNASDLAENERYAEAEAAFADAIKRDGHSAIAWSGRARALRHLGRYEEACEAAATAVLLDGQNAEGWVEQGACLDERGRRADALHAYKRATELDPKNDAAWLGRAALLASFHRHEEALVGYERALELKTDSDEGWLGKRVTLLRLGRREEANEAAHQLARVLVGLRPARMQPREPARSPAAVLGASLGPIAREFWSARRPLLIPALAYVAGLAVWSLNAARNDFGPQIAADLQYFVAGVIPAVVILIAVALLLVLLAAPAWTRHWLATRKPKLQNRLAQIAALAFLGSLALVLIASGVGLTEVAPAEAFLIAFAASFVLVVFVSEEGWFFNIAWKLWGIIGVALLLVVAFAFYAEAIYPELPQALGGGAPRCARLDIQTEALSKDTVATLVGTPTATPAPETARTVKVDILFARDDVLFVKPRATGGSHATHELRGGTVRAVIGCEEY